MIIVSNITGGNTISFIPRGGTDSFIDRIANDQGILESIGCLDGFITKICLRDEVTGDIITEYPTFTKLGYLTQCTVSSDLKEQRRYLMTIVGVGEEELYRGLLFCSTQGIADYSIDNGELNTDSSPTDTAPQYKIID